MTELKKWITTALLTLLLLPAMAQQKADTTYTFRFVPRENMFYVPWSGNDTELARLLECIEKNKATILDGKLPLYVDGYCNSLGSETENLATAKIRANRVKSELITRAEIKEENFITRNHATEGDFVTVRLTVPAKETAVTDAEAEARRKAEAERLAAEKRAEQERLAEEQRKAEEARLAAEKQTKQDEVRPIDSEQTNQSAANGWYAGLQGGIPFGVSQFSSFGADKTRAGWTAGIHGGYRFNRILSLEVQAAWGQVNLAQQDCCISGNYWLGSDGVRYYAPVLGMEGCDYAGLKNCVTMQRYGLQLNADVLGFFPSTRQSRWSVEVSPLLAAVGTKASLSTINDGKEVCKEKTEWHLGVGGSIQAGYRFACGMGFGIYSGVTYLTGNGMDGLPKSGHKANYIWESGLRLSWFFPTNTRKEVSK